VAIQFNNQKSLGIAFFLIHLLQEDIGNNEYKCRVFFQTWQ